MTQDIDLEALERLAANPEAEFITASVGDFRALIRLAREADVLRQACAHLQEQARLGRAWEAAEAALPTGWAINLLWGTVTEERWVANAGPWPSSPGDRQEYAGGATPVAALQALAAKLAEPR